MPTDRKMEVKFRIGDKIEGTHGAEAVPHGILPNMIVGNFFAGFRVFTSKPLVARMLEVLGCIKVMIQL